MSNHLLLGAASPNWQLAVTEDLSTLDSRWRTAFEKSEALTVQVVTKDRLEVLNLWVNPRAVTWYQVIEVPDIDQPRVSIPRSGSGG